VAETWKLHLFGPRFQHWMETENPPTDCAGIVAEWIATRETSPKDGAVQLPDEGWEGDDGGFWQAAIPGAYMPGPLGPHQQVMCSYWIVKGQQRLICDGFGTAGA
jgi:hypothetical protein